uniref:Endonuclease/exonuclease/phosphatase domain-containing protein n=1 Tax=Tetranychus urticae TaxID=32264 RepID=T1L6L5_TETUR
MAASNINKVFVITFNVRQNSTYFYCVKNCALKYANQGHLFVGLQEVPQSVWNAKKKFYDSAVTTRNQQYKIEHYQIGDCACLYKATDPTASYFFNTFHDMMQAFVLPEGIALINTHRSPNMNRGAAKTYWATMRCLVSRLLHGGKDKDNRHFDVFSENTYFGKDGVVARYDYILQTKNIVWRRELEEFDNLSCDHKVIASEFQLVDIEIKQAPFGEHKDLDWQDFKNVIYATFAKF